MKIELHPSVYDFDNLNYEEVTRLKKSLRKYGCKTPVLIWKTGVGLGEKFWLMDGRHRFELCRELDIPFDFKFFEGTEEEAKALAVSLNDDRRHQTSEQKQARIERVAQARRDGKSLRTIAETEKISESQVRRDIEVTTAPPQGAVDLLGETNEPDQKPQKPEQKVEPKTGKVTGRDGRVRTATPRPTIKPPKTEHDLEDFCVALIALAEQKARGTWRAKAIRLVEGVCKSLKAAPEEGNALWDALCAAFALKPVTPAELKRVGAVVRDLKAKEAKPEEIKVRLKNYRREWPKAADTPEALVKHWDRFATKVQEPYEMDADTKKAMDKAKEERSKNNGKLSAQTPSR